MIQSAVTISLVPQARGGPFVFWDDLAGGCAKASEIGFDAVEVFAPSAEALRQSGLRELLTQHNLRLAALGTGAGWVLNKLHLTHPDAGIRQQAKEFIGQVMKFGAEFGCPAIIGSMHGRVDAGVTREQALGWLSEALVELDAQATRIGGRLLLEPVNRYETNLLNSVVESADLLRKLSAKNVRVLGDLFHMNIEETCMLQAIEKAGDLLGHVHLADSNRRAAGFGHFDYAPIMNALHQIRYDGYLSAEVLPLPDSETAARKQMETFRKLVPRA